MKTIKNFLLQNSGNAILSIGSNRYSEAKDPSGKIAERVIEKLDLDNVANNMVVYRYVPLPKDELFNGDGDDCAFFATAPLAYTSRGRKNNSSHYFGFTFSSDGEYNPAYLIDSYEFISKFDIASEGLNEEQTSRISTDIEHALITKNPTSGEVAFGDAMVDSSLKESDIYHYYRNLIVNTIDEIVLSNLKKNIAIVAPDEDLNKIFRIILTLLPDRVSNRISFITKLGPKDKSQYLLYGVNDISEVRSEDDIVPTNENKKCRSLYASLFRGKTISFLLANDRKEPSDAFVDSFNQCLFHLHLEEVAAYTMKDSRNNWSQLFMFFTQEFSIEEQSRNSILLNIISNSLMPEGAGEARFYEYRFDEKRIAKLCNYLFSKNDSSMLSLIFGNILTHGLATAKSPQEVTYLSNLFSLLMEEAESRVFLSNIASVDELGESLRDDIENLIELNSDNGSMDFSPFIRLITIFALENYTGSFNDDKRHFAEYVFPVLAGNYANQSVSKALSSLIEDDMDIELKYSIFELLCKNGFLVNISTTERDLAVICGKIKQVVELTTNFERNKELYGLLKNAGVEDKYTKWLLSYIVAPFSSYDELCRTNDDADDSTITQVHEKTTLFLHQNPNYLNFTNATYLYDLYNNKYMADLDTNIAFEEEIKNKVSMIYEGKTLIDNGNKNFECNGLFNKRITYFERVFNSAPNRTHKTNNVPQSGVQKGGKTNKPVPPQNPEGESKVNGKKEDQTPVSTLVICALIAAILYVPIFIFARSIFAYSLSFLLVFAIVNIIGIAKYSAKSEKTASKYLWIMNGFIIIMPLALFDICVVLLFFLI